MKTKILQFSAAIFLALLSFQAFCQEKPWPNTTVIGAMQGYNPKPQDDFYAAVNREWALSAKMPDGFPVTNIFIEREIQVENEIMDLLTDKTLTGPDAENVQNLYDLFLDWEGRKNSGIQATKKTISLVEGTANLAEFTDCLTSGKENFCEEISLFGFDIGGDFVRNLHNVLYISPTALSLGDSADYKKLSPNGKNQKEYNDSVTILALKKLGYSQSEAEKLIEEKYKFESALASSIMTSEEANSPDYYQKIMNKVSLSDLEKLSPNFPLVQTMKAIGLGKAKTIYLTQPEWLKKMNELYTEENLPSIKAALITRIALMNAGLFDKETFDFIKQADRKRNGSQGETEDEKSAADTVKNCLSVQLSKLYAKHCVDKNAKKRITKIIKDTIKEYRKILNKQDWLCQETKDKAIEKLNFTHIHVAYPAFWDSYSSLKILSAAQGESFYSAIHKLRVFNFEKELKWLNKIGGSPMWNGRIYQVNAFNSFTSNSINIIAGIIGGDFYRPDMSDEELYGKMGVVIGHEISHSFDATGSQFNKFGAMKNWWTKEDLAAFKKKSEKIVAYYNGINSLGTDRQSGQVVQGEATADMGGVKVMLSLAKKKPNFDYKLFFESFARTFACVSSKEFAHRIINDSHPFGYLRVNVTVQQFDEFIEAYGVKPGDKMYLAPEDRIAIW